MKRAILCAMTLWIYGCDDPQPRASRALASEQVPERDIRRIATLYRDEWLKTRPVDDQPLAGSQVVSVEQTPTGWCVIFVTGTGHDQPEGMHDYFLEIHLDAKGVVVKIKRGPDRLSYKHLHRVEA